MKNNQRPTRVLEVTATSLKLRCNMAHKHFHFLALSHIWGDPTTKHLKLELSDVNDFQTDIPWHELSSIYKEVIRVTLAPDY
jgi:hypothetical protein